MLRKKWLTLIAAGLVALILASPSGAGAQPASTDADAPAPLVAAPKIIEALNPKDIVLDRPGHAPRRAPSIDLQVQFRFGSADLLPQGQQQLDQLALALDDPTLAHADFVLAGHTDRVGDEDYNLRLSIARAESVRDYLEQAHGLPAARLQTVGYGFTRLRDPRHPAAAINRRVEVRRVVGNAPWHGGVKPTASPSSDFSPTSDGRIVPTPQ